jgi:hypothetical protein
MKKTLTKLATKGVMAGIGKASNVAKSADSNKKHVIINYLLVGISIIVCLVSFFTAVDIILSGYWDFFFFFIFLLFGLTTGYFLYSFFKNAITIWSNIKIHFLAFITVWGNLYWIFSVMDPEISHFIFFPILAYGDYLIIKWIKVGIPFNKQVSDAYIHFIPEVIRDKIATIFSALKKFFNWLITNPVMKKIGKVIMAIGIGYLIKTILGSGDDDDDDDLTGQAFDTDGDGLVDTVSMDTDGDGLVDTIAMDTDGDGLVDTIAMDTDGDGLVDTVSMDTDGDGLADTIAMDTDGDGKADIKIKK